METGSVEFYTEFRRAWRYRSLETWLINMELFVCMLASLVSVCNENTLENFQRTPGPWVLTIVSPGEGGLRRG